MDDLLDASDADQLRALGHPTRLRLLLALADGPSTVSRLSAGLGTNKGNVAHHLGVLERARLVRRGATRTVRGGTEQPWERVARRVRTPGGAASGHTRALLDVIAEDVEADPAEPLLHLRRIRLDPRRAQVLAGHLDRIVADLPEAPVGAPTYGVLVGLYAVPRRRRPGPPGADDQ